jgi:hypothetical protein
MEWCENLLRQYQTEGFNQHEIILKLRHLLTLSWMDLKRSTDLVGWFNLKRIHQGVLRDSFIHEFIVFELYEDGKGIPLNILELSSKSILQEILFHSDYVQLLSVTSRKSSTDQFPWKKLHDLILEQYRKKHRETLRYLEKDIFHRRCVLIGLYDENLGDLIAIVDSLMIEFRNSPPTIGSLSSVRNCYRSEELSEMSSISLLSCAVHIVDILSSLLIQTFPQNQLCQIFPIFVCHSIICDLLLPTLESLGKNDHTSLETQEILVLDSFQILSWSSGLMLVGLKSFPTSQTCAGAILTAYSPTKISQSLANIYLSFLYNESENDSVDNQSIALRFLSYLVTTKDQLQEDGSNKSNVDFLFGGSVLQDESESLNDLSSGSMVDDSFTFSSLLLLLLGSNCSHVNQVLPTLTITEILVELLREQKLNEYCNSLCVLFKFSFHHSMEPFSFCSGNSELDMSILVTSLLLWWSDLETTQELNYHDIPSMTHFNRLSHVVSVLFSLFASHNNSLLTSLLFNALESSHLLRKWILSSDLCQQPPPSTLSLFSERAQYLAAYFIISFSSNDCPLKFDQVPPLSPHLQFSHPR